MQRDVGARLNRSCLLSAPPLRGKVVSQVMLPNMVFGLWIVLGLSKWAKDPFGQSRTVAPQVDALDEEWWLKGRCILLLVNRQGWKVALGSRADWTCENAPNLGTVILWRLWYFVGIGRTRVGASSLFPKYCCSLTKQVRLWSVVCSACKCSISLDWIKRFPR